MTLEMSSCKCLKGTSQTRLCALHKANSRNRGEERCFLLTLDQGGRLVAAQQVLLTIIKKKKSDNYNLLQYCIAKAWFPAASKS